MKQIKVWAHRGASGYMPENTLMAFQKAVEMEADGIELDIQMSKDGEIVVIHDELINRTSDGKGLVKDYTFEELRRFNYNKKFPEAGHADIPLMKEVFELIKPTPLTINIELKTGALDYDGIEEKIVRMTHEFDMNDRVIYSSFNHYSIQKIQSIDSSAKTAFLYSDGYMNMPEYAKLSHVDALHPWFYNLRYPGFMEEAHNNGLEVNVWTVNKDYEIRACMEYGVDAIITNYPDKVRRFLNGEEG